jgi:hypothetical protein
LAVRMSSSAILTTPTSSIPHHQPQLNSFNLNPKSTTEQQIVSSKYDLPLKSFLIVNQNMNPSVAGTKLAINSSREVCSLTDLSDDF